MALIGTCDGCGKDMGEFAQYDNVDRYFCMCCDGFYCDDCQREQNIELGVCNECIDSDGFVCDECFLDEDIHECTCEKVRN